MFFFISSFVLWSLLAIICDGTCIIFDGETNISTGKQQKQGGESALNSNLAGKHTFLVGHTFTLAGQRFSGVVTWGWGCIYAEHF